MYLGEITKQKGIIRKTRLVSSHVYIRTSAINSCDLSIACKVSKCGLVCAWCRAAACGFFSDFGTVNMKEEGSWSRGACVKISSFGVASWRELARLAL